MFLFEISQTAIILFGSALFLFIILIFIYLRPLWRVRNAVRREVESGQNLDLPDGNVPVSVIIYANDDAEELKHLLPSILGQDYASPFEVIVVNEGQSPATAQIVERLRLIHDNLYLTYTPEGAMQLSRKKLALMIGIKAARYPYVVHTIASANIDSDRWLARMTAPFADDNIEVVIGQSTIRPDKDTGFGRRGRLFNAVADRVIWLNSALSGKPYRGTELNLAYTRDIFFNNRGFSRSLNLKYGDDDIFVHEIANGNNTAVVLHPESKVCRDCYDARKEYKELRSRYYFTGQYIPKCPRRMFAFGTLLLWVITGLCVAGSVCMLPNLLGVAIGALIFLTMIISVVVLWRGAIKALEEKKMMLTLPFLAFMRPVANTISRLRSRRHKRYNYTWN